MTAGQVYAACAAVTAIDAGRPGVIVALHGLTGTRAQPIALLDGVARDGLGVLAPDLRAHGDTPLVGPAEDFTPAVLAADVAELVRRRGLDLTPICVLGISLGATVALELLRRRTLNIVGGIFVRPAHAAYPPAHLEANQLIATLLRQDPATAMERLLSSAEYRAVGAISPSGAAGLRDKITKPGSMARVMRLEAGSRWTAFSAGERVDASVPTLVLGMRRDPLHPVAVAEEWHARIVGSTLVILPSRDEDPEGSAAGARSAISRFLDQLGALEAGRA